MSNFNLFFIICFCFLGCQKEIGTQDEPILIFGYFYGECIGEDCIETFKIEDKKLYEDVLDYYSGQKYDFVELPKKKYELVKDLFDHFPAQLLEEKETVIGCPDCSDGGGLTVEYITKEFSREWKIDLFTENVPTYLHPFINLVTEKINLIQK